MSTAFSALRTDDIHASLERLLSVLRRTHHVHDQDPGVVETLDHMRGRHTNGAHKELRPVVDDHVDELVELAVCVVVVCLAGVAADLWEGEVDAEGERLVLEQGLELRKHLVHLVRGVAQTADDTEATGVGDCGCEGCAGGLCHACEEDGALDAEEGGEGR